MNIHDEGKLLADKVFAIKSESDFEKVAIEVFQFQYKHIEVYREFVDCLNVRPSDVRVSIDIPFLPIEFFKTHKVYPEECNIQTIFQSSGTTGQQVSKHHIVDLDIYERSFFLTFEKFYGAVEDYTIMALLPSYLEREGASLVYMVDKMIRRSGEGSGFYLNNTNELLDLLKCYSVKGSKVLLIGVSFALLELVEKKSLYTPLNIIMETGGMKGRRKELIREELHEILSNGFGVDCIHSEYGMTELLSQSYSLGNGRFSSPPWKKILCRELDDPLSYVSFGKSGGVNVIDLANVFSCSFIATKDIGKKFDDGTFEILGRFDQSDVRGCNLMVY